MQHSSVCADSQNINMEYQAEALKYHQEMLDSMLLCKKLSYEVDRLTCQITLMKEKEKLRQKKNETVDAFVTRFRTTMLGYFLATGDELSDEEVAGLLLVKLANYHQLELLLTDTEAKNEERILFRARQLERRAATAPLVAELDAELNLAEEKNEEPFVGPRQRYGPQLPPRGQRGRGG